MRAVMGILAVVAFGSGCGHTIDDCRNTRTCEPPPDAGTTVIYVASDAGVKCDGVCVPLPGGSTGFYPQPFLRWDGPAMALPIKKACPSNAPVPGQSWYSTPDPAQPCPTCSCAPPTGVCMLPETVTVSASPMCPSDAGVPFNPPDAWDGGCTTNDAIAALECDGGDCSATVGPMLPVDECVPNQSIIPKLVTWGFVAYSCNGKTNDGECNDAGEVCVPQPPKEFNICVSRQGDDSLIECPQGYPARSVFYVAANDDRGCTACGCDPPQGSTCSSLVSLYTDGACSMQIGAVTATSSSSMCVDIPAASSLGSKQASPPTYIPGSCQPNGGKATGTVQPLDPFTFCCQK